MVTNVSTKCKSIYTKINFSLLPFKVLLCNSVQYIYFYKVVFNFVIKFYALFLFAYLLQLLKEKKIAAIVLFSYCILYVIRNVPLYSHLVKGSS